VGVGPVAVGDGREIEPGKPAVGLIENVHADFFFDDVALVAEIFVVDAEGAHAVSLEPEHAIEGVGGDGFEIVGDVVTGGAVEDAAGGIDEADVDHFAGIFRALEHHVLEEMGEAAAAAWLEAKADVVVDADGDHGSGGVWGDDHAKAVGERPGLDGNV